MKAGSYNLITSYLDGAHNYSRNHYHACNHYHALNNHPAD